MGQSITLRTKANTAANVILFTAVATFAVFLGRHVLLNRDYTNASLSPDGKQISLTGINFAQSKQTVMLVLDKNCRFCKQQVPFYRRLAEQTRNRNVKLVIAFNHTRQDGQDFLREENIAASEVIRVRLKPLDIRGTPALLLLNHEGKIIGKWVGELSQLTEDYIVSILGLDEQAILADDSPFLRLGNKKDTPTVEPNDLRNQLRSEGVALVDIDDRADFAMDHLADFRNIPADELYSRALNELQDFRSIVLFSRKVDGHEIRNAELVLRSLGFKEVKWLKLSLGEAHGSGF